MADSRTSVSIPFSCWCGRISWAGFPIGLVAHALGTCIIRIAEGKGGALRLLCADLLLRRHRRPCSDRQGSRNGRHAAAGLAAQRTGGPFLVTGEAQSFHAQLTAREALYEDPPSPTCGWSRCRKSRICFSRKTSPRIPPTGSTHPRRPITGKNQLRFPVAAPQAE